MPEPQKEIQSILDRARQQRQIDGASLAFIQDGKLFETAHGHANLPEEIAATPATLFHIGSVTKSLTAELVWKLVARGRLAADLPVVEAAPELSHISTLADRNITISHLLSHTAGIDGDLIFDAGRGKDVLRRYLSQVRELGTLFAPGAHFSYANIGYGILGRIVELAAGASFEELLANLLRADHGLSRFAILPIDKIRQRTAVFFSESPEGPQPAYFWPHSNIASGTVLAMSMTDLARWGASHFANGSGDLRDLSEEMRRPAIVLPHNHRYEGWGHGFILLDGVGDRMFGHDGGTAGTSTYLRIAPHQRVSWAFSATGPGGGAVYQELEPYLRRIAQLPDAPVRPPPGAPVPHDLSRYTGIYERFGMSFAVREGADRTLNLSVHGPMAPGVLNDIVLKPLTALVFNAIVPALGRSIWLSFHDFDANGRPALLFAAERMVRRSDGAVS